MVQNAKDAELNMISATGSFIYMKWMDDCIYSIYSMHRFVFEWLSYMIKKRCVFNQLNSYSRLSSFQITCLNTGAVRIYWKQVINHEFSLS